MSSHRRSLIPDSSGWLRILRLGLLLSSIGWGISFLFTVSSWESASEHLYLMGADRIEYQPLLDYWLRMASATFGCIGIASAVACIWPARFEGLVCLIGPFHGFIGTVLATSAISNHLKTERHPTFVADITFCYVTALLVSIPLLASLLRKPVHASFARKATGAHDAA